MSHKVQPTLMPVAIMRLLVHVMSVHDGARVEWALHIQPHGGLVVLVSAVYTPDGQDLLVFTVPHIGSISQNIRCAAPCPEL